MKERGERERGGKGRLSKRQRGRKAGRQTDKDREIKR